MNTFYVKLTAFTNCKLTRQFVTDTFSHSNWFFFVLRCLSTEINLFAIYTESIILSIENQIEETESLQVERRRRRQRRRIMWKKQRNEHFNWLRLASSYVGSWVEVIQRQTRGGKKRARLLKVYLTDYLLVY